jgi:hypothetical protein
MGFFARFGRLYDSVVADSTALAKAVRGTTASPGERRMAALSGGVGQSAYPGAWGAEKSNQVQQFNGWLSSCVRYKARLVGTCPRAVRMGKTAEKDKDRGEYKRLSKAYHAGAVSAPPARRKWLGVPYRKAAVSPDKARDAEELEHLDDDHDLSRLLADPNGPDVGLVFWPYFAAFYYLCGESFIWKVRDGAGSGSSPSTRSGRGGRPAAWRRSTPRTSSTGGARASPTRPPRSRRPRRRRRSSTPRP